MSKRKPRTPGKGQRRNRPGQGRRRTPTLNELRAKKSTDAKIRAHFIELYATGRYTLAGAADAAGTSTSGIWRARTTDPEFDAQVKVVLQDLDGLRVQLVEDGLFDRLERGEASAAEVIFFLCNREPKRWRSVSRLEHTGGGGGPIRVADLTKLTTAQLGTLEELLTKCGLELQT